MTIHANQIILTKQSKHVDHLLVPFLSVFFFTKSSRLCFVAVLMIALFCLNTILQSLDTLLITLSRQRSLHYPVTLFQFPIDKCSISSISAYPIRPELRRSCVSHFFQERLVCALSSLLSCREAAKKKILKWAVAYS